MTSVMPQMERMLGALLRIPFQAINQRIANNLVAAGFRDLRPSHFNVFQHLPAEGARQTELAERAQMTKQSMGALIEHLEASGYVERVPDPVDGRAQIIRRTDRGWQVERIARESIRSLEEEWSQSFGEDRFQEFRAFLEDLAESIETS